jgi:hypothetical protein
MKKCQPVTLTPYLDGELSDELRREIDQHLQSCAACGTKLEELTDATRQVSSMGRAVIPMAALTPALDIFIERAGLTPSSEMVGATEVTRAGPTLENLVPEADQLAVGEIQPATESPEGDGGEGAEHDDGGLRDAWSAATAASGAVGPIGIPDDEFRGQKSSPGEPAHSNGGSTPEPAAGDAQARTWIEPEPWFAAEPRLVPETDEHTAPLVTPDAGDEIEVDAAPPSAGAAATETHDAVEPVDTEPGHGAVEPQTEPVGDDFEGLEEHPSPPPPEIRPPWMEAPSGSEEDLEEAGRRAVDEVIAHDQYEPATPSEATSIGDGDGDGELSETDDAGEGHRGWLPSLFHRRHEEPEAVETAGPEPEEAPGEREVAASSTGMAAVTSPTFDFGPPAREPDPTADATEPGASGQAEDEPEPAAAVAEAADDPGQVPAPARGLGSLNTQLRIGLLGVLVMVIVVAAVLLLNQGSHAPSTAPTASRPGAAAHPSPAATPSRGAPPSPAPSATSAAPANSQLTEVVTAGAGGSGWRVARIRTGSPDPASGITRVVFDLEGAGPTADAQLGRGHDGAVYLTAPGVTISPAALNGFDGRGVITGITQTGTEGLALRLATSGSPGFSIGYLSVPTRLVLDFK